MNAVFSTFLVAIFVLAAIWIGLFGTAGASVRSDDAHGRVKGFVIGALLGPLGLLWLTATRRRRTPTAQSAKPDVPVAKTPPLSSPQATSSAPSAPSGPAFDL